MQGKLNGAVAGTMIAGERSVAMQDGSGGRRGPRHTVVTTITGASPIDDDSRCIVLISDRCVHLFKARYSGRPKIRLGSYPLEPGLISFDGRVATFPDGQTVDMTARQALELASAAKIDHLIA